MNKNYIYIFIMAGVSFLIRALPMTLFRKPIKSQFVQSFLYYVPTACLAAMTFPAILTATGNLLSGAVGLAVAVGLALKKKSMILVAVASCAAVFMVDQLLQFL